MDFQAFQALASLEIGMSARFRPLLQPGRVGRPRGAKLTQLRGGAAIPLLALGRLERPPVAAHLAVSPLFSDRKQPRRGEI